MAEIFIVDNQKQEGLVADIVEAIKSNGEIELVVKRMGRDAIRSTIKADDLKAHYISESDESSGEDTILASFNPDRIVIASRSGSGVLDETVVQIASGKCSAGDFKDAGALLMIPLDNRFPAELEINEPGEALD